MITRKIHQDVTVLCAALIFTTLLCYNCTESQSALSKPQMWGELEPGSYTVGFRSIFTYDLTQPSVPYSDWDGKLFPTTETKGRQMQINIWYPSKSSQGRQQLQYGHYVDLMAQQTDFGKIDTTRRSIANQQFINKTNALGGGETFTQEKLDSLRDLKTLAYLNAPPVDKSFPLIVFPNGGSPAFQSIMCEYFASHGYIVGAMALKGSDTFSDEVSARGIERAVTDLDFGLSQLLEIPQVDGDRIGMIGNAITSSQIVAYQNRNPKIDCIISLEGGLLSSFEQRLLQKTAFYEPAAVDVPIMAIYAPHPSIDPNHIDHLIYAERYYLHFPQMSEFHFLNYGPFERIIPDIIGEHEGDVVKGFEWGSRYALSFWNAFLSEEPNSLAFLRNAPEQGAITHIDTFFIKEALPKPPEIAIVKDAFLRKGFSFIDSVYQAHKPANPTPFSKTFYNDLKDWLAWKKDPNFENRYQLYLLAHDSYPESAVVNYYLAHFALQTERKQEALIFNKKALKYLESDDDPTLTSERKSRMKAYILEDLARL